MKSITLTDAQVDLLLLMIESTDKDQADFYCDELGESYSVVDSLIRNLEEKLQ
jgi:hypothetical protein